MSPNSKTYAGHPNGTVEYFVTVNGAALPNIKEEGMPEDYTGFCWGYGGSGPNALASSLLFDYFEGEKSLEKVWHEGGLIGPTPPWIHYARPFLDWFVRPTSQQSEWVLTSGQIDEWLQTQEPYDMQAWERYVDLQKEHPGPITFSAVRRAVQALTDFQLAALNNVMQVDWDPRKIDGYDKVSHLFTTDNNGIPIAHRLVKRSFAAIVNERLTEESRQSSAE